jgi:hypothetical protein
MDSPHVFKPDPFSLAYSAEMICRECRREESDCTHIRQCSCCGHPAKCGRHHLVKGQIRGGK